MRHVFLLMAFLCVEALIPPSLAPVVAQEAAEITFWNSVKDTKNPAELKAYLDKYPSGTFSSLAKIRLNTIEVKPASRISAPSSVPVWASLSFTAKGAVGFAWNRPSREQAEQEALTRCTNMRDGRCKTVASHRCIGLAVFRGKIGRHKTEIGAFTSSGDNVAQAMNNSLERCRTHGVAPESCNLRTVVCADGSHRK